MGGLRSAAVLHYLASTSCEGRRAVTIYGENPSSPSLSKFTYGQELAKLCRCLELLLGIITVDPSDHKRQVFQLHAHIGNSQHSGITKTIKQWACSSPR